VWFGLRVEAEAPAPDRQRLAALAAAADELPSETAPARAYRALALAEHARAAAATADWAGAVREARASRDPYLVAYARLRHAQDTYGQGDRDGAARALEEAASLAAELGAAPLLDEARALARRARLRLPGPPPASGTAEPAGVDSLGLTERELEVLSLLAAGRSNPQIADELFISPKTASVHVSNIIGKLNVTSRGEAAAVAHRLGVEPAAERASKAS
jgi:DNA-binding CsgD family transcriptional regulator